LPPGRFYRLAWAFYLGIALCGGFWLGLRIGVLPLSLFVDPQGWWIDLGVGAAAGALLLGLWQLALARLTGARELEASLARLLAGLTPSDALGLAAISGFAEELFFRGAVQGAVGWLVASLLFALLHTGPGPSFRLWTLYAGAAGMLLGGLMAWRGNLLAPTVAHVLVNAVNLRRLAGRAGEVC
jgi:membrane protease YdiL (CAAX protease family)